MIPPELLEALNSLNLQQKQELLELLAAEMKQQQQALRDERRSRPKRQVVRQQQQGSTTFQQEWVDCGNERCRKCVDGPSHGPYWYAYAWSPRLKKVVSRYVGKKPPIELEGVSQE